MWPHGASEGSRRIAFPVKGNGVTSMNIESIPSGKNRTTQGLRRPHRVETLSE